MYAYDRTNTPKLPWKPRIRPIDLGRSSSSTKRPAPLSPPRRITCGTGRNGSDPIRDGDGPRPRPAAAVRLREGLVQVEVDDVEAHVAGPRDAHDRVEVGAV